MSSRAVERILIRGGTTLTMDSSRPVDEAVDLLIDGGHIVAIGPDLGVTDARVIDASGHYVMPGFVDTHRHTWQSVLRNIASDWSLGQYITGMHFGLSRLYRPHDTYIANLLGLTEALDSGITTMLDWSHGIASPEHADAAVAGLRNAGARAVFAHGGGAPQWQIPSDVDHPRDIIRIRDEYFRSDDQLVTLAFAARGPQYATRETTLRDWALARQLDLRITVHAGDGAWGRNGPVRWMHEQGLTGPNVTYVHCNTIDDSEIRTIVDTGGTASIAADIETQMGHGWPATGRFLDAGLRPSLSVDVCSSNGGDMFHALKSTITTQRALDNAALEDATDAPFLRLSCWDVLEFATHQGAIALGLDHKIGTLEVGKEADVILVRATDLAMTPRNNPAGALVYSAHAGMVDTVLVAGRVVKHGGVLLGVDVEALKAEAEASAQYLFEAVKSSPGLREAQRGGGWMPAPAGQ